MTIPQEQKLKLESMQIKGIRYMIWNCIEKDDVENRLLQIKHQSSTSDIHKLVYSQSRSVLIELIERSPEITPEIIDSAYEKYRYGLKPGFTLFWAKKSEGNIIDKESLEKRIKEYIQGLTYVQDAKYKNLEFISVIPFGDVYEITLSYLQKFNYINEDGEHTFVYMMKECFAWIGIEKNFVAINNMPEILMTSLKRFFSKLYNADITNIKITNDLLKKVFPNDKTKKITRHNANPPENQLEKITIADPNLSEKKDCIPAGYEDYDVTSTQYIEDIDENTTGTLGVNCNKGKLYLAKSLTSTQFRTWSTRRIDEIIGYFQNSSDVSLSTITGYNMFTSSDWDHIKKTSIKYLNELAYAIISCKKSHLTNHPISFDLYKCYLELSNCFQEKVRISCDICEDEAIAWCTECGGSQFNITKKLPGKIICNNCGKAQSGAFAFECENGHTNIAGDINEIIELVINDDFYEILQATIKIYYPEIVFEKGEYISVSSLGLSIHKSPNYEKLKPSDIADFADIANREIKNPIQSLKNILNSLQEKCTPHPTNDQCSNCKYTANMSFENNVCILRLFESFEGYTPAPHQGHEFGDVSMLINLHGQNVTFVGVAKKVDSRNSKITKSSQVGREIIQQVIDAFNENRAEVVGVIYPDIISDQLKHLLYHQAKIQNKKLVILDHDFMLRLLDKFVEDKGLKI